MNQLLVSSRIKKLILTGLLCLITQSIYNAMLPEDYIGYEPAALEPKEQGLKELTPEQLEQMPEEEQIAYITKLSEQEEQKRQERQQAADDQELQEAIEASQKEQRGEDKALAEAMSLSAIEQRRAELRARREQKRADAAQAGEEDIKEADYVCLDRNQLFENIMGMSEPDFKNLFTKYEPEHKGKSIPGDVANHKPNLKAVNRWFINKKNLNTHPRSYAVLQGELFPHITLKELRTSIYGQYKNCPMGTGTLSIITPPDETDIRRMHEIYPNAFFMIASNFNALEGGMGQFNRNLNGMNHAPVQGEEAALATMGAAIYRRYLVPRINQLQDLGGIFDLQGMKPEEEDGGARPFITSKIDAKKAITRKDMEGFAVTLHKDIVVTSGASTDPNALDRQMIDRSDKRRKIPICNKQMPTQGPNVVTVSHILTSAHDLSGLPRKQNNPGAVDTTSRAYPAQAEIARAVLDASYEATILTAMEYCADQLILTLIGASAFRNDAKWIVETLERLIPLIVASNIDIKIVLFEKYPELQAMVEGVIAKIEQYKKEGNQAESLDQLLNI
ncbi:MAG TPA: hypothetical protein VGT41_00235 [Candidatus Babeliales bacterium]|nr:hypothetical protein [Candidatus Babeliales bacterium]